LAISLEKIPSFDELDRQIRSARPDIEALSNKTAQRRALSEFLLRARYRAGLNQSQVAKRAGWDKSFVSRMESVFSPVPDLMTIARYISACGEIVGLAVSNPADPQRLSIVDALFLDAAKTECSDEQKETNGQRVRSGP
jgi:transcriptional regulator with XRE-family HTH domain